MEDKKLGNVLFLLSRAEHPRMWRRVLRLSEYCRGIEVFGFERKNVPLDHPHKFTSLGKVEHAKFLSRIPVYLNAIRKSTPRIRDSDVCYSFSLDILIWVYLSKVFTGSKAKLVYEIADIHPLLSSGSLVGTIVRYVERYLIKRTCAVVFTSENFYSGYFKKIQKFTDFECVTIENKVFLPRSLRERLRFQSTASGPLTIGYFGLIKSTHSFEFLVELAERMKGAIRVKFAGRFVYPNRDDVCQEIVMRSPYLEYCGPYCSPDDLESLYGSVELVWNAYCEGANASWQRTTRFSEACFFKRPVIYNPDTQDGKLASRYDLGIPMRFGDLKALEKQLFEIDGDWLKQRFENFDRVPESLVYYGNEYEKLVGLLED